MLVGGEIGYWLLRALGKLKSRACSGSAYRNTSKLETLLGSEIWREVAGRKVIDFGCGFGNDTIEIAEHGAASVIGLDIRPEVLAVARNAAVAAGVSEQCRFVNHTSEKADVIISVDCFEHFDDPAKVLQTMTHLLEPGGCVLAAFGPPWYHPFGPHLPLFPWAHLIFTESSLMRWRGTFSSDGAKRFREVPGGLNCMTLRRFEEVVRRSDFRFEHFEAIPIKAARRFHGRLTREFLTSVVRCKLIAKAATSEGDVAPVDALGGRSRHRERGAFADGARARRQSV